jgi:hypothetical protein
MKNQKPEATNPDAQSGLSSASLLACAVRGLIKLIDDGDIVRNTDGDGDTMVFLRQGIRITNALKAAQDALNAEAQANDRS